MLKPILFNTEMVRAILDGRKTVTRRVVKLPKSIERDLEFREDGRIWWQSDGDGYGDGGRFADLGKCVKYFDLSPYRPGDILYVRETWSTRKSNECYAQPCHTGICPHKSCELADGSCFPYEYIYKATDSPPAYGGGEWRPSIHMPREAARIFLRVTDVRVERLQEIKETDVASEGLTIYPKYADGIELYVPPREQFAHLWDSTIKPADRERYGWTANPWVWVIEFERCEKPEIC